MTNTLSIGQTQYPTVRVGDHSFANISVEDFLEVPPAPIQRNSERRVSKMKPIFDEAYAANQSSSLTEVVLGIISQDFNDTDPDTGAIIASYKKDEVFILDGNTRRFYWKLNPERAKQLQSLTAKIHFLSSMEDMKFAYYPYNSKDSVEKAGEILQGLARRYNWIPRQPMFANGGYKTALDWSSSIEDGDVHQRFNEMFEELKMLDSIPKSGHTVSQPAMKCLKSQPIMAALLIALKTHKNNLNLYDFIERLSNITDEDCKRAIADDIVSPVEVIAIEWRGWSPMRGKDTDLWLKGLAGTTKFASREPQLDFLLYWISEFIKNPKCTNNLNKGIKPTYWEHFMAENIT